MVFLLVHHVQWYHYPIKLCILWLSCDEYMYARDAVSFFHNQHRFRPTQSDEDALWSLLDGQWTLKTLLRRCYYSNSSESGSHVCTLQSFFLFPPPTTTAIIHAFQRRTVCCGPWWCPSWCLPDPILQRSRWHPSPTSCSCLHFITACDFGRIFRPSSRRYASSPIINLSAYAFRLGRGHRIKDTSRLEAGLLAEKQDDDGLPLGFPGRPRRAKTVRRKQSENVDTDAEDGDYLGSSGSETESVSDPSLEDTAVDNTEVRTKSILLFFHRLNYTLLPRSRLSFLPRPSPSHRLVPPNSVNLKSQQNGRRLWQLREQAPNALVLPWRRSQMKVLMDTPAARKVLSISSRPLLFPLPLSVDPPPSVALPQR